MIQLRDGVLPVLVVTLILVVGAPFFEELFFRGLVQGAFTNGFGTRFALFAQAVCFGLVHFRVGMSASQAIITVVTIGATGLVLGSTRWHYEKLGPGMVRAHVVQRGGGRRGGARLADYGTTGVKRNSFSALPRRILYCVSAGRSAEQLLGHADAVGPRGVAVRVVGLEHHVVLTDDVERPQTRTPPR